MACPRTVGCPLYGQFKVKSLLQYWCIFYCESKYETCARYQLALKGEPVPPTLLPNGTYLRQSGPDKD